MKTVNLLGKRVGKELIKSFDFLDNEKKKIILDTKLFRFLNNTTKQTVPYKGGYKPREYFEETKSQDLKIIGQLYCKTFNIEENITELFNSDLKETIFLAGEIVKNKK